MVSKDMTTELARLGPDPDGARDPRMNYSRASYLGAVEHVA